MKNVDLIHYLESKTYPGRGIAVGRTKDGKKMRIAYFIMGRSSNSRNRIFVEDGQGIRTEAFDPSKLEDPSLIIYAPVRVFETATIVTNGDQTDTIYAGLANGYSFEDSLRTRTFEPDGPNYTPRISAMVVKAGYRMSILKSADGDPAQAHRQFFDYVDELPGVGHIIHTYQEDGNPLPSFEGEPVPFTMEEEDFETFTARIWDALNEDNKVSLFTREIEIETGDCVSAICNRNA